MQYEALVPGKIYRNQKILYLPKGAKTGFEEAVIICAPTEQSSWDFLNSTLFKWHESHYKRYATTMRYREKIGMKNRVENRVQDIKTRYKNQEISKKLILVPQSTMKTMAEKKYNLVYDISYWNEMWFKYRKVLNAYKMCNEYITFLENKIDAEALKPYHKVLLIPIDLWAKQGADGFGITKAYLDDPISIMMCSVYRFPDLAERWRKLEILIIDSMDRIVTRIDSNLLTKKKFSALKISLKKIPAFRMDPKEETLLDSAENINEETLQKFENSTDKQITQKIEEKKEVAITVKEEMKSEVKPQVKTKTVTKKPVVSPTTNETPEPVKAAKDVAIDPIDVVIHSLKSTDFNEFSDHTKTLYYKHIEYKGNKPIGFIYARPYKQGGKLVVDMNLAVIPEYRGKGIAYKMAKEAIDELVKDPKVSKIYWGCTKSNFGSIELARRIGLTDARDTHSYDKEHDELYFWDKDHPLNPTAKRFVVMNTEIEKRTKNNSDVLVDDEPIDVPEETATPVAPPENAPSDEIEEEINEEIDALIDQSANDEDINVEEIKDKAKEKVLVMKFKPDISDADMSRISQYMGTQDKILEQSVDDMEAKVIHKADVSVIKTSNDKLAHPRAKNFYKNYNDQCFEKDVDNAVAILSKADYPLFIVDKTVTDTSDTMNLKKTYDYTMKDQAGREHHIVFDMPIFIDDRYIYLGGNKKVIENQFMLKPIIKYGPDEVQIATFYNKNWIFRRGQKMDVKSESLMKILTEDESIKKYHVRIGNSMLKNRKYNMPLDFDIVSMRINECTFGYHKYIFDSERLMKRLNQLRAETNDPELTSIYFDDGSFAVGYNTHTHEMLKVTPSNGESLLDLLINELSDEDKEKLKKGKYGGSKLMFSKLKIFGIEFPLILMIAYCVGLTKAMEIAHIKYQFVEPGTKYDTFNYSVTKLKDKWILWDRYPYEASLLMNGLAYTKISDVEFAHIDDKMTYINLISYFRKRKSVVDTANALDQFKDFMIDPVSAEVLRDMGLPDDYPRLLVVANMMLNSRYSDSIINMKNVRVRSNEIFAQWVYEAVTAGYMDYRKTVTSSKKPRKVAVAKNLVMTNIYGSTKKDLPACSMVEDASVLNPILELEKQGAVSYRGPRGINLDDAIDLQKRSYNETMAGTVGVPTSPDAGVGILRQLTFDPNITSTRGYVQPSDPEILDEQTNTNLMTPAELLSPPGALHDDAHRTAMSEKQSKYMVLTDDMSPVMIGNKVESAVPYYISREFVVTAKDDGEVVAKDEDLVIIQYKNGKRDSFSLASREQKNSAGGFYIETEFTTNLEVGSKVKKDQVVAYNPKAFTMNNGEITASMNIGALTKIAILPDADEYEDSSPITSQLSERLATTIVTEQRFVLNKNAIVRQFVKVGDHVEVGDPIITYDKAENEEDFSAMLNGLIEDFGQELISTAVTVKKADHTGEIAKIQIYSSVELSELSPTLRPIVKGYWDQIKKHNKVLDKYKNENDSQFYQCGQQITEVPGPIDTKFGKILSSDVGEGVLIRVFTKHKDLVKKGDKITNYTALKGITSVVIDKGLEPYSEFRKDEEISAMIAPSSILARKTPSIFISMFGNKVMIELKRALKEIYLGD